MDSAGKRHEGRVKVSMWRSGRGDYTDGVGELNHLASDSK